MANKPIVKTPGAKPWENKTAATEGAAEDNGLASANETQDGTGSGPEEGAGGASGETQPGETPPSEMEIGTNEKPDTTDSTPVDEAALAAAAALEEAELAKADENAAIEREKAMLREIEILDRYPENARASAISSSAKATVAASQIARDYQNGGYRETQHKTMEGALQLYRDLIAELDAVILTSGHLKSDYQVQLGKRVEEILALAEE